MEWKDTTSYSRGQRGNIEPTSWTGSNDKLSITLTKAHIYYRGHWIMHCRGLGIDTLDIKMEGNSDLDEVKAKSIRIVKKKLNDLIESLP